MKKTHDPILVEVFKAFGNASRLAEALQISRQAVFNWNRVPLKHVRFIAEKTGMKRDDLRPDIYG